MLVPEPPPLLGAGVRAEQAPRDRAATIISTTACEKGEKEHKIPFELKEKKENFAEFLKFTAALKA